MVHQKKKNHKIQKKYLHKRKKKKKAIINLIKYNFSRYKKYINKKKGFLLKFIKIKIFYTKLNKMIYIVMQDIINIPEI